MNTAKVRCLYDELLPIDSPQLKPNPDNPNDHTDDQIDRLGLIIETNGWRRAIRISKQSGFMTVGHGALMAAKKKGWSHVPVNYQDYDSPEEEYSDMVADNAIGAWSELNREKILNKLPDLQPLPIEILGLKDFKLPDLEKLTDRESDGSVFDRTHEQYTGSIIKQIVLFFKAEEFPDIVQRANQKLVKYNLEDYSSLFLKLLDNDDARIDSPTS